jgi:hypothetical protein
MLFILFTGGKEMRRTIFSLGIIFAALALAGCSRSGSEELLKGIPLDGSESAITRDGVYFDQDSSDGNGSLRLVADDSRTFELFEVTDVSIDNARLIYRARVKSKDVTGKAYLEMWVRVPGKGEFFSRGLQQPILGNTGWATRDIPFFLQKGQKADLIRLNMVIEGPGTVWIDDIRLLKGTL